MKREISKLLLYCKIKFREYSDYFQLHCPFARQKHNGGDDKKPSMSIYEKKGKWYYKCFTCGEGGEIWFLFDILGHQRKNERLIKEAENLMLKEKVSLKESIVENWFKRPEPKAYSIKEMELSSLCKDYLIKRGIEEKIIYKYNVVSIKENTMLFPIWYNNEWIGGIARTIDKVIWIVNGVNISHYLGGWQFSRGKFVVLVEGFLDVMYLAPIVWELEGDVYSVNTSQASKYQLEKLKETGKPVFIMFDNDMAGKKGVLKTISLSNGIKIKSIDYEAQDVKQLDKKNLKKLLTKEINEV